MEDPEYQESERIGPLIVKTVVLSYLDDPVEEVAGQPDAPEDNAGGNGNLPPVVGDAEVITRAYEEAQGLIWCNIYLRTLLGESSKKNIILLGKI